MTHLSQLHNLAAVIGLSTLAVLVVVPLLALCFKEFRKKGLFFTLIAAGFLYSMATKPPLQITFDDYLRNANSSWITNEVGVAGVAFAWTKTNQQLPSTQPLYIARTPTNETAWTVFDTTTVGGSPRTNLFENAGLYKFWVYHDWVPPTPVHTNGVWLGNVLERTKKQDAILVIQGQMLKDGKVIAPCAK